MSLKSEIYRLVDKLNKEEKVFRHEVTGSIFPGLWKWEMYEKHTGLPIDSMEKCTKKEILAMLLSSEARVEGKNIPPSVFLDKLGYF